MRVAVQGGDRNLVTTDIAPIGAFFAASEAPEPGSLVNVTMRPDGMKVAPIEVESMVVRVVQPGGIHQPGFAVRWLIAHSDASGEPLYRVLKRILRVPEVSLEMFGHEREVEFVFPDVAEEFSKVLQISDAPKGPLLQQRREEKRSGPPKAPPPVQAPIEKLAVLSDNASDAPRLTAKQPARRAGERLANVRPTGTARAKTFKDGGARRRVSAQTDDIMAGAGVLLHRDSDVTQVGGRSRSLSARRDSAAEAAAPTDVMIVDDIRVTSLSAVGKTLTERLIEKAREQNEQKANVGERSQIFGKAARLSSLGGRSMNTTIRGGAEGDVENSSVKVDVPITYELDNHFIPARIIQASPLALEVIAEGQVPKLDQNLVINMPVQIDGIYRTINLMGKLLRVPEAKDDDMTFVFHIERVHEGEHSGAFTGFIADQQNSE